MRAFDKEDAVKEFFRLSSMVLDILSIETNSFFSPLEEKIIQEIEDSVRLKDSSCPLPNTFVIDEDWMDDCPRYNVFFLVSTKAIRFIDYILAKNELRQSDVTFLRACHHFQIAREYENSYFLRRSGEIATVLYLYSIEVASTIDFNNHKRGESCRQEQFKISSRIVEYVNKYLGLSRNHSLSKDFKTFYAKRSKYLHSGILLGSLSLGYTEIPILDPSSDSGASQYTSICVLNLREWIGYMLRKQLKTLESC